MKHLYTSYVRAFEKYAKTALNQNSMLLSIARYAMILNEKANQLLRRGILNNLPQLQKLQKELFEMGREYVKKFGIMLLLKKKK